MRPARVSGIVALALAAVVALDVALADPIPRGTRPAAPDTPPTASGPERRAAKPKPRRVLIFGTTIVGDVLKPTIEKSLPWQNPPAFRTNATPLAHDFTQELLAPLDRDRILRETDDHAH